MHAIALAGALGLHLHMANILKWEVPGFIGMNFSSLIRVFYTNQWRNRNQPHVFTQLQRYGLHKSIKTSNGTLKPEKVIYKPATGEPYHLEPEKMDATMDKLGGVFFGPDGLTSRDLMPYPHDPFREPALWKKYDHLSLKDRIDQVVGFSQEDKDHFEALMTSIGSGTGTETGFIEPLRWYALGGHTVTGMFEIIETFKLGGGGQSSLAKAIFSEYRGHVKMQMPVKKIVQSASGVAVSTQTGRVFKAKYAICTIPL